MTNLPPAPEAILQLVQCGCSKERCSTNRCQCRKAGLNCTDLCNCSDNGETCDNDVQKEDVLYSDEEDSSDSEMYIHEWATWTITNSFLPDNHAKEVKVDFDMLLKLLWKVIHKWQGKVIWFIGFAKLSYCSEEKTRRWQTCSNKRVQITESVFILIKLVTCPIFVILISLKQFIKHIF